MDNYESIIRHYRIHHQPRAKEEVTWFSNQPTLQTAIKTAGMALDSREKRFSHQRRLRDGALKLGTDALLEAEREIARCRTFDELFEVVKKAVGEIRNLGELYVYDTAFRLGCKLGLMPTKVYLHSGTRDGARVLGLQTRDTQALDVSILPRGLQVLEPHEIEDVLCIYKDQLTSESSAPWRAGCC